MDLCQYLATFIGKLRTYRFELGGSNNPCPQRFTIQPFHEEAIAKFIFTLQNVINFWLWHPNRQGALHQQCFHIKTRVLRRYFRVLAAWRSP